MIKTIRAICFILFVVTAFFAGVTWQRELGDDQGERASTAQVQTGTPIERVDPYAGKTAREVLGTFNLENPSFDWHTPSYTVLSPDAYPWKIEWSPHDLYFSHSVYFEVNPCSKTVWMHHEQGEWEPLSWEEYENIAIMLFAIHHYHHQGRDKSETLRLGRELFESRRNFWRNAFAAEGRPLCHECRSPYAEH